MKNIKDMIILHIVTYLILFLVYPSMIHLIFPWKFRFVWKFFFLTVSAILHGIVFWKGQYKWYQRLVGMIVLWRLASWYSNDGMFGISEGGVGSFENLDFTSAAFDAMVVCVKFFFFQSILVLILKIIRRLKEKKENDTNVNG